MYFETSSAAADMHSAAPDKRSAAVNSRFAAEKGALRQTLNGLKIEIFRTLYRNVTSEKSLKLFMF